MNEKLTNPAEIEPGDFIWIPAWRTDGMVMEVRSAMFGSDDCRLVLLQSYPDEPRRDWRLYRLEPGEFEWA